MKKCSKCPEVYSDMMHFCPNDGNPLTPIASQDPFINSVLDGKYLIEESIGKGGMGLVYRAKHVNFNRLFAIKILKNELVSDPQAIKRFRNEANAAGMIRHPNAITISDFNITNDGTAYLVMDYVEGKSLRDILKKEGRQSYRRTVNLIAQVADAAAAAHRKGIIHRDLKPDNIMVEDLEDQSEMVRVLDFGIAKLSQNPAYSENITVGGAILGSPYYMSPEQCDGRHLDNRSDIYSIGIILYELLVGKVPFRAQTPWGLVKMHCSTPPTPIRNHRADIPPALEAAVLKALAKDPKDRQQSALELKKELEAALNATMVNTPNVQPVMASPVMAKPVNNIGQNQQSMEVDPLGTKPLNNLANIAQQEPSNVLEQQKLEALAKELEAEISQIRARKDSSGGLKSAPLRDTSKSILNDIASELAEDLSTYDPKKAALANQYSASKSPNAISPNPAIKPSLISSYTTNPHSKIEPYSVPTTTPHSAISATLVEKSPSPSQMLATTSEPLDIAEEFSLALPEMVEDVLMSVSETILTKTEVLSQRVAQEAAIAAQTLMAEAKMRMQNPVDPANLATNPAYQSSNINSSSPRNLSNNSNLNPSDRTVSRPIPGLVEKEVKSDSEFKKQLMYIAGGTLLLITVIWLISSFFRD
ncbi:MAG: serine/threonine protein kinase [Acidobacteria bacterium]|nr:serine/threonine protein kinase [Acidobacteriota bacterium]